MGRRPRAWWRGTSGAPRGRGTVSCAVKDVWFVIRFRCCVGSCKYIRVRHCHLQSETNPAAGIAAGNGQGVIFTATGSSLRQQVPHPCNTVRRESNFVKQQQVALKLSKQAAAIPRGPEGGEHYGWWVVLSILLQARAALRARASGMPAPAGQVPAVALEPEKLMALAEGMVSRQVGQSRRQRS